MEVSSVFVSKDKITVFHRDEKLLENLKKLLEKYGIHTDVVFSSFCG